MRKLLHGGHDHEGSGDDLEELRNPKIGLIVGIFFLTLIASYIPWIIGRAHVKNFVTIISILTCFAAGIIISGGFNHILPGAEYDFAEYWEHKDPENKYKDFPFPITIAIFVMFILLAIDKIVVERGVTGEKGHNHMNLSEHSQNFHNHTTSHTGEIDLNNVTPGGPDEEKGFKHHEDDGHGHHSHKHGNGKSEKANTSQAWLFLVALSVHSILDGLGLGTETHSEGFYGLLVAVLAHKLLDGFALGVPIYFANFSFLFSSACLVFCAAMTPLGIGIGMAISTVYDTEAAFLAKGIVLSVTLGSFIYISLIELLPSGLCTPGWIKLKLSLAFLGWAIMAIIALWV